jgi:phospholipid/cholesterol/gamma-HCH transport system permease protein
MPDQAFPRLTIDRADRCKVVADGAWQVQLLAQPGAIASLQKTLRAVPADDSIEWDLSRIAALDHLGAQIFWNAWNRKRPLHLKLAPQHEDIFERIEKTGALALPHAPDQTSFNLAAVGRRLYAFTDHVVGFIILIGQLMLDLATFAARPLSGPWKEISANIYHAGYRALGITALVGFLIGVVLSYLSAQQLHTFGGDIYLVNILGMSIVRELGPLLAAILVAGRSGSAITAQLGVMRVTEELDAMLVMGMPHGFRLILPKVIALAISMPLLVIWTDTLALAGGVAAADLELGLAPIYFVQKLPEAVPIANYWIGLGKGVVFGSLIALVACHFGLRIEPDTESLGRGTTLSVVTAITIVILADAVFAIVFNNVGYY